MTSSPALQPVPPLAALPILPEGGAGVVRERWESEGEERGKRGGKKKV